MSILQHVYMHVVIVFLGVLLSLYLYVTHVCMCYAQVEQLVMKALSLGLVKGMFQQSAFFV